MSFVMTYEFSVRVTKVTSRMVSHELTTFLFLTNLNFMNYGHFIESMQTSDGG